jgi:hypothetical protein
VRLSSPSLADMAARVIWAEGSVLAQVSLKGIATPQEDATNPTEVLWAGATRPSSHFLSDIVPARARASGEESGLETRMWKLWGICQSERMLRWQGRLSYGFEGESGTWIWTVPAEHIRTMVVAVSSAV